MYLCSTIVCIYIDKNIILLNSLTMGSIGCYLYFKKICIYIKLSHIYVNKYISFIILLLISVGIETRAQSGFSNAHGDMAPISYALGQTFYKQFSQQLTISEGIEQAYLVRDTIVDDGCEYTPYDNFNFQYGDTLTTGLYTKQNYSHQATYNYDSVSILLLTIHPQHLTTDTILVHENELGENEPGENRDTLTSQFGCDSVIAKMIYVVYCPEDIDDTAAYGVENVPLVLRQPAVLPVPTPLQILSDAPLSVEVGTSRPVVWQIISNSDTLQCTQNVAVHFPPCGGDFTVLDGDSNAYETVRVGADCWTRQNIYTTLYSNGDTVDNPVLYPYPRLDTAHNLQIFGLLYDWYAAVNLPKNSIENPIVNADGEVQGVCPTGWHLPSLTELETLASWSASDLKLEGEFWIGDSPENGSGFSAAPSGIYDADEETPKFLRASAHFWSANSATQESAYQMVISAMCENHLYCEHQKQDGCSVRCVKD